MNGAAQPTLRDALSTLWRGLPQALILATLAAAAIYYVSEGLPQRYESAATLIVGDATRATQALYGTSGAVTPLAVELYQRAAFSDAVLEDAIRRAGVRGLEELVPTVTTEEYQGVGLIQLSVTSADAQIAAAASNAVAEALVAWDQRRVRSEVMAAISGLERQIEAIDAELEDLAVAEDGSDERRAALASTRAQRLGGWAAARALVGAQHGSLQVFERAEVPPSPVAPAPQRNAMLAFVLGLFASYALDMLRGALDPRPTSSHDLGNLTGLPLLAAFPRRMRGKSQQIEERAAGFLRANTHAALSSADGQVVLVTGAALGDDAAYVARVMAESYAATGRHTLLIDTAMHRPMIAGAYGLQASGHDPLHRCLRGLCEELDTVAVPAGHHGDSLHVLPTYDDVPGSTELLDRGARSLIDLANLRYDVVIINAAPLNIVADALTLAPWCSGVVLAVSSRNGNREGIQNAVQSLQDVGAFMLGVVVTDAPKRFTRAAAGVSGAFFGRSPAANEAPLESHRAEAFTSRGRTGFSRSE